MQFLRTLFWVVVAVFLPILSRNTMSGGALNPLGRLHLGPHIPPLIAFSFLLGLLPTLVVMRGRMWTLKRRLAVQSHQAEVVANPPAVDTGEPAPSVP